MLDLLREKLSQDVREAEPMAKHTTFKVGGPAEFFFVAKSSDDLAKAAAVAKELALSFFVFGGGSNMLVSDDGIRGLVVKAMNQQFSIEGTTVVAEAGVPTGLLSMRCAEAGLTGFEWAVGVPGSLGGAVRGNAGAYGGETKDGLVSVRAWKDGAVVEMTREECAFGYRDSVFKHNPGWLVLSATFTFAVAAEPEKAKEKLRQILLDRKAKQPVEFPTAGCMFANWTPATPEELEGLRHQLDLGAGDVVPVAANGTVPAGWIIEKAGLKGTTMGHVRVSEKHGNFFITDGQATADEVLQLTGMLKTKVRNMTDGRVQLFEEVEYVGF